jgi:N-acetylornithine carbamoyltransferase
MKHFTRLADLTDAGADGVPSIIDRALDFKRHDPGSHLAGRQLAMLFFNPSLRTRVSFESAMARGGGYSHALNVGSGVWQLETADGAVMDGAKAEHVREAAPVLGRYADALAVRTFATLSDLDADHADAIINAFRAHAEVPVISMESAREHPCQGLADLLTLKERFGDTRGLPVTLTWAPHIKPLPRAVPNSFLLTALAMGCDVRIAHPPGFELHDGVLAQAEPLASSSGGSFTITSDQHAALDGSAAVYAKSWGPVETADVTAHPDWQITPAQLQAAADEAVFMHCLPVRRNVEVADAVLDREPRTHIDQAENRLHAQRAVLDWIWNGE